MKKVLFVATIFKHFRAFHIPYIEWFKQQGWQVDAMANGDDALENVHYSYNIPLQRNPFDVRNLKAIRQAKKIIEREQYDIVYCHTAMGSVLARLASIKARKKFGTKIIYVAHGFHFFKGGPKKSWIMYYPMEKFLSKYTDAIITINQEDYDMVKTHRFKNTKTFKIPGIGMNTDRLFVTDNEKRIQLRKEYGYKSTDFMMIYTAEYIYRKNHKFIIDSLPELINKVPDIKFLFAGRGRDMESTIQYAKNKEVDRYIDFLGFRKDIGNYIAMCDAGVSASRQEGLGLNLAEEMFAGLPVVATVDRGHCELVKNHVNGILYPQLNHEKFIEAVEYLYLNPEKRIEMGHNAYEYIQKFKLDNSLSEMKQIFDEVLR